ncbi:AraC family transcriptional regulator [Streptomyces sp. NPDC002490]|uniref:helix-turn-helix domain-containing protein n=1 Tax=Streptomyces sp. NPDC002490 TaxID=3154416 RepID=UPI00331A7526
MVKNGHVLDDASGPNAGRTGPGNPPIPHYGFHAPDTPVPGIEVTDLATLRQRVAGRVLQQVHRTDFHALTLITGGKGRHTVDFVTHPLRPGTLLWVRPGQVQRFHPGGRPDGPHLIFTTDFPPAPNGPSHLRGAPFGPTVWDLSGDPDLAPTCALFSRVSAEYGRPPGRVSTEVLRFLLAALLLHVERLPHPGASTSDAQGTYARFRTELERSYHRTRRAEDYATTLGYSVKSLTRACLAATGQPVKQVIDARVVLQAKRLLAHTDDPVSGIARQLGFSEATNFGTYFVRHTGTTPGAFRRAQRGGG